MQNTSQEIAIHLAIGKERSDAYDSLYRPKYTSDLNAMHEAEKVLDQMQARTYADHLADSEQDGTWAGCHMWSQTAAQRAEAFLKTLNLWTVS